ncbi:MAG: exonuclease SbcCD subunit D [Eubacteriales bacterium]
MLRMLHLSDVHLDAPHTMTDLDAADVRRAELRAAFSSMMLYIRQNDVRLVLIAGDLFDNAFVSRETVSVLHKEFSAVPQCHFVIAPGNRDYYAPDSVYAETGVMGAFPDNVHIFRNAYPTCFRLDDIGVQVWGFAHTSPSMDGYRPLSSLTLAKKQSGVYRIFCGHAAIAPDEAALSADDEKQTAENGGTYTDGASVSAESGGAPLVTREELARLGFDYAALGHLHTSDGIRRISCASHGGQAQPAWTYFGYSGCLVGRGFDECGFKGAVCGVFDTDPMGNHTFSVRRLRIARRHYEVLDVDFTGKDIRTQADAYTEIKRCASEAAARGVSFDADAVLRVTLKGPLPASVRITHKGVTAVLRSAAGAGVRPADTAEDRETGHMPDMQLILSDDTVPYAPDTLHTDPTLRGAFYRELRDALESDDADMREVAGEALRAGLAALE